MSEEEKKLEEEIKKVLRNAPELKGYTPSQLKKEIKEAGNNWPTDQWHFEKYGYGPTNSNERIGSFPESLEKLKLKRKKY